MGGGVHVSREQEIAFWIIEDYRAGRRTLRDAATVLGVSPRTAMRMAKRVAERGLAGLRHGNTAKRPRNRLPDELRERVLGLIRERYFDFNLFHAREKLCDVEGIRVSYATLHTWCRKAGVGRARTRRRPSRARVQRERMANEGLLMQMDGSRHKWNGRDEWTLIAMIDDATSDVPCAEFFSGETTLACLKILRQLVERRGIPDIIYTDEAGWSDRSSSKRQQFSQFKRACEDLGIRLITTRSPQAKGRIERAWRTAQDRLVPEFRLGKILSMAAANSYLTETFLPYWRRELTVEPRSISTRYRPVPAAMSLDQIFCLQHKRVVLSDHTVSYEAEKYRIVDQRFGSLRGQEVAIHDHGDDGIEIYHGHLRLRVEPVTSPKRVWREGA